MTGGPGRVSMTKALVWGSIAVGCVIGSSPAAGQSPSERDTAGVKRALLDRYCVVCHNDKAKTANLSLEKLDLTTAGDNPELWEKVVRKLRAGVMPPPGVRRPPLAEYQGLRDWLETEIDRKVQTSADLGVTLEQREEESERSRVNSDPQ